MFPRIISRASFVVAIALVVVVVGGGALLPLSSSSFVTASDATTCACPAYDGVLRRMVPSMTDVSPASLESLLLLAQQQQQQQQQSHTFHLDGAADGNDTNANNNSSGCAGAGGDLGADGGDGGGDNVDGAGGLSDADATTIRNGKYGVIPAVFILAFGASLMPWLSTTLSNRYGVDFISFGACLSSGVIIGAGFSHMLPDAEEAWTNYFDMHGSGGLADAGDTGYPFAPLLAIATMFTLVFVDNYLVRGGIDGRGHEHSHGKNHSHLLPTNLPRNGHNHGNGHGHGHAVEMTSGGGGASSKELLSTSPVQRHSVLVKSQPTSASTEDATCVVDTLDAATELEETKSATIARTVAEGGALQPTSSAVSLTVATSQTDEERDRAERIRAREAVVSAWVFFVALSIHSVFDGLSVGVEDSISGFSSMLVAVLVHKGLDGFALGIPLFYANLPRMHTIAALIFCAGMTPLGIGIGMAATEGANGESGQLAKAVILSMSTGSFFFIGMLELLPAGLSQPEWLRLKMFLVAFGWGVMALLAKWV